MTFTQNKAQATAILRDCGFSRVTGFVGADGHLNIDGDREQVAAAVLFFCSQPGTTVVESGVDSDGGWARLLIP